MFRITKAFENQSTFIYRIEGQVADDNLETWTREMIALSPSHGHQVILDFSRVWSISQAALMVLLTLMQEDIFVLNCGMEVRNILHASGFSSKVLE